MFADDDDYNASIPLAYALERPNACRCTLVRTATGFEVTYGGDLGEAFNGYVGDDGWTETAALGFGRISDGSRVTAKADPKIEATLSNAVFDGAATAAAAGIPAHSLGDKADSATAVVTAPEPGAPAAVPQPPPAGLAAQDTPALDSGGAALTAVATAAELLKSKPAAEVIDAAELAELKTSNHEESGSTGGAGGPGNAKGPAAPRPKPPTAMEKEQEMPDMLLSIRDRANELLKHDPEPAAYLMDVVRLHCANPAFLVLFVVRFLPCSVAMAARRWRSSIRLLVSFRTSTRASKRSSVL